MAAVVAATTGNKGHVLFSPHRARLIIWRRDLGYWGYWKEGPQTLNLGAVMSQKKDPCQKAACAIQKCMQANNYKERLCQRELEEMQNCCSKLLNQTSVCCSGFNKQTEDGETRDESVK